MDPCPGTCGINARCQVVNHNPICSCSDGLSGDPFTRCTEIIVRVPVQPCDPNPCGPNSICQVRGESPACSCLENYVGTPPNCRPECTINPECSSATACINQKCRDPCPGSCGQNAVCSVVNHNSLCTCNSGFEGDPFIRCIPKQEPGRIYFFSIDLTHNSKQKFSSTCYFVLNLTIFILITKKIARLTNDCKRIMLLHITYCKLWIYWLNFFVETKICLKQ